MNTGFFAHTLVDNVKEFCGKVSALHTRKEQDTAFEVLHSTLLKRVDRKFANSIHDALIELVEWKEEED